MKNYKIVKKIVGDFDVTDPSKSAELTQEMCDLINPHLPIKKIMEGKSIVSIFAPTPVSLHASSKKKAMFKKYIKESFILKEDKEFKDRCKNKELEIHLIFFITRFYNELDVDNRLKVIIDALQGHWFKNDSQIKKIIAEKHKVKKLPKGTKKQFFEQIYCCLSIIE